MSVLAFFVGVVVGIACGFAIEDAWRSTNDSDPKQQQGAE